MAAILVKWQTLMLSLTYSALRLKEESQSLLKSQQIKFDNLNYMGDDYYCLVDESYL